MNYKALAAGAVLGFLLAVSPGCGEPEKDCGPNNCQGCCATDGTCTELAAQSVQACGASGQACTPCAANQACSNGACAAVTPPKVDAGTDAGTTSACNSSNCPGCCTTAGLCLPGTAPTNCGVGGTTCVGCGAGQTCQATGAGGQCKSTTVVTDGGTDGGVQGDGGTTTAGMGAACTAPADCTGISSTIPICKTTTTYGNLPYQDGYCTRRCYSDSHCTASGANSRCVYGLGWAGEAENICLQTCTSPADCRPGYACYKMFNTGPNVCWILPPDGGSLEQVDAGPPIAEGITGAACTDDTQCQDSSGGWCNPEFLADGGLTGVPGGDCSSQCTYGGDEFCGDGGTCVLFLFNTTTNQSIPPQDQIIVAGLCEQSCNNSPSQDVCRTGYYCSQLDPNGTAGYCSERCDVAGNGCGGSYPTCNAAGQCCNAQGQCR